MIGEKLTEKTYNKLTAHTNLNLLTMDELIELAIEVDKFWDYAGIYYKLRDKNDFDIIIDREQSVGGYNNTELVLSIINNKLVANDEKFKQLVCKKIEEKSQTLQK